MYIAERTDAMVAIFAICGLLCVHRYYRSGWPGPLIGLNVFFVLALLAKEVAVAMVPMAALYWWYLRIEERPPDTAERTFWQHWGGELRLYWSALVRREPGWVRLIGPMLGVTAVYLIYRQVALPPGSLTGRFAETQNPISALIGGINSTFKGVPWQVRWMGVRAADRGARPRAHLSCRAGGHGESCSSDSGSSCQASCRWSSVAVSSRGCCTWRRSAWRSPSPAWSSYLLQH